MLNVDLNNPMENRSISRISPRDASVVLQLFTYFLDGI